MRRAQPEIHTMLLRNPNILATAKACLGFRESVKILSFGCSMGDELASIKLLFPTAQVYGCDIDEAALATAERSVGGLAEIFLSTEEAIRARGPFDLVCAFSCLCMHPPPRGPFAEAFPYARFEEMTALLGDVVAPGGVLALYNTSYLFQHTPSFADFTAVRSDVICRNGFINLYDKAGEILVEYAISPSGVSVRAIRDSAGLTDYDLVDCVFAKTGGGGEAINLRLHDPEALSRHGYEPAFAWTRSELDAFPPEERGRFIDMRRRYRAYVAPDGDVVYAYDVLRDSIEGRGELLLATYGPLTAQMGDKF